MRSIVSVLALSFLVYACGNKERGSEKELTPAQSDSAAIAESTPLDTVNVAKMQFEEKEFDFGNIKEGDVVKHVFKFTNVGKTELVINNARGSCGCTIPSYPKEPIAVGASNEIEVQFNSKGKSGANHKVVSIIGNTYPDVTTISIKANVQPLDETLGPMAK